MAVVFLPPTRVGAACLTCVSDLQDDGLPLCWVCTTTNLQQQELFGTIAGHNYARTETLGGCDVHVNKRKNALALFTDNSW